MKIIFNYYLHCLHFFCNYKYTDIYSALTLSFIVILSEAAVVFAASVVVVVLGLGVVVVIVVVVVVVVSLAAAVVLSAKISPPFFLFPLPTVEIKTQK